MRIKGDDEWSLGSYLLVIGLTTLTQTVVRRVTDAVLHEIGSRFEIEVATEDLGKDDDEEEEGAG